MLTLNHQNVLVCRLCMLQDEDYNITRIAWYEWQDSALAAMYESVMKQPLHHSNECLEMCYCNKCAELLCQTAHALQMFQRSDTYWRNICVEAPSSSLDDLHADVLAGLITNEVDSFKMESVEIELLDGDYEEHLIDANENENKYKDFWKMIHEVEQIDIDSADCTDDYESPSDTEYEIQTEKNKRKPILSKIMKQVKPKAVCNDKLPCVLCNEVFSHRGSLNRHTKTTHNVIQCLRCPFTATTRQSMRRHEVVEHKRTIDTISPCPKCSKVFLDLTRLRAHIKNTHAPLVSSQCHVCSRIFSTSYLLSRHMKNVHVNTMHECDICKRKFRQKKNLKLHIMIVHVREAKFICTKCGRKFTNQITWKKHEERPSCARKYQTYNPNPIFSCSLCDLKFCDQNYGRSHYQKKHQIQDFSIICLICNCLTSSPDELSKHLREKHHDLCCSLCKRYLKSQISFKSHMASHSTKERPFACKICEATFIRAVHLNDHQRRVHLAQKPHKCTDCDQHFVTHCEMIGHWRHKHDPNKKFQCNMCAKKYATVTALSLHETIHTGIGKYNCDICRQNFRFNHQLVRHFQTDHRDHEIR